MYLKETFKYNKKDSSKASSYEFGFECVGEKSPYLDIENILMNLKIINFLGLGSYNLKINNFEPHPIVNNNEDAFFQFRTPDDIDYYVPSELAFIGRSGTDRENANLIVFLASDEASYISAQNIQIDGCRKKQ